MASSDHRLHAHVSGYVQGVGFRAFALRQARFLGVLGYVKNLPDGSVEVVAEGPREQLDALLVDLRRGPYGATVQSVAASWLPATGEFPVFGVRY